MGAMDWVGAAKLTQNAQPAKAVTPMEINNAVNDPNSIGTVLQGAKTGAGAGSSFGPYGTAIGGIAGAVGGGLEAAHSHENDQGFHGPASPSEMQGSLSGLQSGMQQGQQYLNTLQGNSSDLNDANNLGQLSSMGDVLSDKRAKQNIKSSAGTLEALLAKVKRQPTLEELLAKVRRT